MRRVRPPAAAGRFYPSDPEELAATVDRLLAEASPPDDVRDLVGLIIPHAGYEYSGPVAATSYAMLKASAGGIRRSVLLGPSHFVPLVDTAVPEAEAWRTPLGEMPVDRGLVETAVKYGAAWETNHMRSSTRWRSSCRSCSGCSGRNCQDSRSPSGSASPAT